MANRPVSDQTPRVWRFQRLRNKPSFIYVLRPVGQPYVKIGRTRDLYPRISTLQTGNPHPLELLFVMKGGGEQEAELHSRLGHSNVRGEWFELNEDVERALSGLRQFAVDHDAIMQSLLDAQNAADRAEMMELCA